MVTYLLPVGGVILGVVFLNEQLSWQLLVGTLLIILSLVVVNWQSIEKTDRRQAILKIE
jgi:drug/metabolite transporter (DMT)-like permease